MGRRNSFSSIHHLNAFKSSPRAQRRVASPQCGVGRASAPPPSRRVLGALALGTLPPNHGGACERARRRKLGQELRTASGDKARYACRAARRPPPARRRVHDATGRALCQLCCSAARRCRPSSTMDAGHAPPCALPRLSAFTRLERDTPAARALHSGTALDFGAMHGLSSYLLLWCSHCVGPWALRRCEDLAAG